MRKLKFINGLLAVLLMLSMTACGNQLKPMAEASNSYNANVSSDIETSSTEQVEPVLDETVDSLVDADTDIVDLSTIPDYSGIPYVIVNNNEPFFSDHDKSRTDAFETYSELDELGRCGVAYANICKEIMPTEDRGEIGSVKPSGWQTAKYNGYIEGNYLYNRCHLIGYQLAGENANEKNLITGTRYMNCDGQLPFEDMVDDYVDNTNHHVLYRVTPVFEGNNLVASGILTEAYSVEDNGNGIKFCVYCYNVQPGIAIDYSNGNSELMVGYDGEYATTTYFSTKEVLDYSSNSADYSDATIADENVDIVDESSVSEGYVLNTNSLKIHTHDCRYASDISENNREETTKSVSELEQDGYTACKVCNP